MLVSDIVRRNADFFGDCDAVIVPGQSRTTWAALEERTTQLANALGALGLARGDRVAYVAPNCAEYIELFFAGAKLGIIGAAVNIRLSTQETTAYLRYVEPAAVVVHAAVAAHARTFLDALPSVRHVVGMGAGHGFALDYEELLGAAEARDPGIAVADTDPYQLGATSGTTGTPKGAVLTHRNAIAAMLNWAAEIPIPEQSTNLQNIPLFFNPGGPAGLHPVLLKGGRTVIHPGFDAATFLRSVPEYSVTHTILVPTMIAMVLDHEECGRHDLSTLLGITCGGSPVPRELLARGRRVFGNVFFPFYGMAETYSCGTVLRRENQHTEGTPEQVARLASAGKPMVLMEARVVADDGSNVPPDGTTPGEVWMRGDTVSPEYFRMPEESAAARHDGWFRSGDVAVVDAEGFITIVDRLKDIIITGGINVFSREVEEVLHSHPAVAHAAVVGVPHPTWGEAIHAVVVARPGAAVTEDALMAYAAERLSGYKKPRSVELVAALPLGATGKVLKKELRRRYWEGRERAI